MDANVAMTSVTISGITVAAIQAMKRSRYFPWLTKEKTALMRGLSALSACAGAVGIHHVWSPTDHTLLITGLSLVGIAQGVWFWAQHFVMNELVWQATKPQSNPAVVEAVAPAAAVAQGIVPEKK